jgi:hypothetical protein
MNGTYGIEALVALFIPLLIAVVKQSGFPATVNGLIAMAVYIITGVIAVAVSGQTIDLQNILPAIGIFTTGGSVAYLAFWKNLGEPKLVAKTSIIRANGAPSLTKR